MSSSEPIRPAMNPGHPIQLPDGAPQPSIWNLANALTMSRIALVPVYGWMLLHAGGMEPAWRWLAAVTFSLAMLTDRLDGSLARSRGLITDVGKILDPIADKALTGMALVGLSVIGEVWWWVTVVVLAREVGITALRLAVVRQVVVPAGRGGKIKTALQSVALAVYSAPVSGWAASLAWVVMAVAVVVTLLTGIRYLIRIRAVTVARSAAASTP